MVNGLIPAKKDANEGGEEAAKEGPSLDGPTVTPPAGQVNEESGGAEKKELP